MTDQQARPDSYHIMEVLVPEWAEHFLAKAAHYRDKDGFEPHTVLGERGQFADIWRKIWPLKKAMWDGEELGFEGKREILLDLIGHCFLSIALIDRSRCGPGGHDPIECSCELTREDAPGHPSKAMPQPDSVAYLCHKLCDYLVSGRHSPKCTTVAEYGSPKRSRESAEDYLTRNTAVSTEDAIRKFGPGHVP